MMFFNAIMLWLRAGAAGMRKNAATMIHGSVAATLKDTGRKSRVTFVGTLNNVFPNGRRLRSNSVLRAASYRLPRHIAPDCSGHMFASLRLGRRVFQETDDPDDEQTRLPRRMRRERAQSFTLYCIPYRHLQVGTLLAAAISDTESRTVVPIALGSASVDHEDVAELAIGDGCRRSRAVQRAFDSFIREPVFRVQGKNILGERAK